MRGAGLQAFHQELVPCTAASDENLALGQMAHAQGDLQSDVFHKSG